MVSIDTIGGWTVEFNLQMEVKLEVKWCQLTPFDLKKLKVEFDLQMEVKLEVEWYQLTPLDLKFFLKVASPP